MTRFDEEIVPRELQMMKAFLPFLPGSAQRMCAVCIKWTELRLTVEYFRRHKPVQQEMEFHHMLDCLKGFLSPQEQSQMDQFTDIFENIDLYREMFESFAGSPAPDGKEDFSP